MSEQLDALKTEIEEKMLEFDSEINRFEALRESIKAEIRQKIQEVEQSEILRRLDHLVENFKKIDARIQAIEENLFSDKIDE